MRLILENERAFPIWNQPFKATPLIATRFRTAAYQERVTGTPKGIAYRVPKGPDDFVKFDGYDAERDVLQDAKLLRNWPKPDLKFSRDEVMRQLRAQLEAAKGKAIEWIVPDQVAADRLMEVFSEEGFLPAENNFSVRIAP